MLLCSCKWLTSQQLSSVIEDGARTVEDITRCCGAGGDCGGCVDLLQQLLDTTAACDAESVTDPDVDSTAA